MSERYRQSKALIWYRINGAVLRIAVTLALVGGFIALAIATDMRKQAATATGSTLALPLWWLWADFNNRFNKRRTAEVKAWRAGETDPSAAWRKPKAVPEPPLGG